MISCQQRIIRTVEELRGSSLVELEAPSSVTMEVFRQPTSHRLLIHLINGSIDRRPVSHFFPVQNLRLTLHWEGKPKKVFALRENNDLKFHETNTGLIIEGVNLKLYDVIVIEQ
jgi:hypothetical protein